MDIRFELKVLTIKDQETFTGIYYAKSEGEALKIYNKVKDSYDKKSEWMLLCKDYNKKGDNRLWGRTL